MDWDISSDDYWQDDTRRQEEADEADALREDTNQAREMDQAAQIDFRDDYDSGEGYGYEHGYGTGLD